MEMSSKLQKMIVFLSTRNPIWVERLEAEKPTQLEIAGAIGISPTTPSNWKKAGYIPVESAKEVFENFYSKVDLLKESRGSPKPTNERLQSLNRLMEIVQRYDKAYWDDGVHVYEAAKLLPLSIQDCQQIVDDLVYSHTPLLAEVYSEPHIAETDFDRLRGFYYAWLKRGDRWLRCTLRVRYTLKIGDGTTIRCKLNLPIIDTDTKQRFWQYDGFLAFRNPKVYWVFEKREKARGDFLYFITATGGNNAKHFTMAGEYLTTGQDEYQAIASGSVLLIRQDFDSTAEQLRGRMLAEPKAIPPGKQSQKIDQQLKAVLADAPGAASRKRKPSQQNIAKRKATRAKKANPKVFKRKAK